MTVITSDGHWPPNSNMERLVLLLRIIHSLANWPHDAACYLHPFLGVSTIHFDGGQRGKFMMQGWSKLKSHFKVAYREIPRGEFSAAVSIVTRHTTEWILMDDEPAAKKYHFPLELADPHDRWCGNAWMTPRVLLDPKNRPLELELIEQLEKDGHDVTGVKVRIVAMRQNMEQTEEAKEILRYLHDRLSPLVEKTKVGLIERGKNVLFSSKPNPGDPIERHVFASQL